MYTIITGAVLGIIIGLIVLLRREKPQDKADKVCHLVFGGIIGAVVGVVAALFLSSAVAKKDFIYGPAELVAMRNADGISGTFIFGSGGFRNTTNYNFMMKTGDGSMVPGSVTADGYVHISEDPSLKNTGQWTTTYNECDPASPLWNWTIGKSDLKSLIRHDFRVPVGTVVQQFKVQ